MAGKQLSARLKGGQVADFSAGPNLRDAAPKLALNESSDAWNVTFDERGNVASRKGYAVDNVTPYPAAIVNMFWSNILAKKVVQAGAILYLDNAPTTARKTFTSSAVVTFAELNSLLIACHPVDGIWTSADGITWTVVADVDAPTTPTCCATWQNKLFVGDATGKLSWSAAGDATNWVATDFNKIWEKDQTGIVNLRIGSGQNILGKPGLVVFKQESSYRVNDSATGAYTTIDATIGAAGPLSVTGVGAKVITLCKRGICWWQEGQIGFVNASDRFLPLWQPDQINLAQQAKWSAGRKGNRAVFSLTRSGSSVNDLALEFHPDQDWIAPRSDAMACYATSTGNVEALYGASPTVSGQAYTLDSGGTDNGTGIAFRFQTRWFSLNEGFKAILWQIRMHGRGTGTVTARFNFAIAGGVTRNFALTTSARTWDTAGLTWDSGLLWDDGLTSETSEAFYSFGACRQFSLLFQGTATTTVSGTQVLGTGTAPTIGAFGLSTLEWLYVPLGLS